MPSLSLMVADIVFSILLTSSALQGPLASLLSHLSSSPVTGLLLSDLATNNCGRSVMIADVTGAFLYGLMTRTVFVELPPELGGNGPMVGLLRKSLYGIKDAPLIWNVT